MESEFKAYLDCFKHEAQGGDREDVENGHQVRSSVDTAEEVPVKTKFNGGDATGAATTGGGNSAATLPRATAPRLPWRLGAWEGPGMGQR